MFKCTHKTYSFDRYECISYLTRGRNHSKDNISYNSCISACECAAGQKDLAAQLVAEMRNASLDADLVTFNASISFCENLGC